MATEHRPPSADALAGRLFVQSALHAQQSALHRQSAAVAAQAASGAQDAVTGDHDRDRIAAAGAAGGAHGALVAGALGDLHVAAGLAVGDVGDGAQGTAAEVLAEPPVERQLEVPQPALEVEVELAAGLVEAGGRLEHSRGYPAGQILKQL